MDCPINKNESCEGCAYVKDGLCDYPYAGWMKPEQIKSMGRIERMIILHDYDVCGDIINAVSKVFGVDTDELKGKSREDWLSLARQVTYYLIRQDTGLSLCETGEALGGKTPSTVSHGYQKIAGAMRGNGLKEKIEEVRSEYSTNA